MTNSFNSANHSAIYSYQANSAMINGYSISDFNRSVAFEAQRNLVSIVSNAYDNVSLSRFAYTNDAAGRRTNREDSGSAFASTQANSFGYNARNEVTSADMRNGASTYTFDQIGTRVTAAVPAAIASPYVASSSRSKRGTKVR